VILVQILALYPDFV